tara:strand:- start:1118 stop:1630 length:513 start_codon:yes stop_codon:yes gene_type:complete
MIQTFSNYDKNELIESGINIEGDVFISRTVVFHNPHNIFIGDGVRIDHGCLLIAGKNTKLTIHDKTHINAYCSFHANTSDITICKEVDIGIYSVFFTSMYDFNNKQPRTNTFVSSIYVEDYAIIGPSCIVLPGVTVGQSASIGANSLVKKSIECNNIVAGNPCKLLKIKQ